MWFGLVVVVREEVETGSLCIALDVLELALYSRQALNGTYHYHHMAK